MYRIATITIQGVSPYSPSQEVSRECPKKENERPDDYEKRAWRFRAHVNADGKVIIPASMLQQAIQATAKYRSEKIPGKGQSTWTKHFLAGTMVVDPILLPYTREDAKEEWVYANADGVKGSGTRVWRCFPRFDVWGGTFECYVVDSIITEAVFERTVVEAGRINGLGRYAPRRGGSFGRFAVKSITWREINE
jgi:hypothetical protein